MEPHNVMQLEELKADLLAFTPEDLRTTLICWVGSCSQSHLGAVAFDRLMGLLSGTFDSLDEEADGGDQVAVAVPTSEALYQAISRLTIYQVACVMDLVGSALWGSEPTATPFIFPQLWFENSLPIIRQGLSGELAATTSDRRS